MSKKYTGNPIFQKWDELGFLRDTRHLHWQARNLYRALLQSAWYESTRPDIINDDAHLVAILGVPPNIWDRHKGAVRSMFQADPGTGNLFQKRLRADWEEIALYREKQAANGKKGGRPSQVADAKGYKPTANPPLTQPITSREEKSISNQTLKESHEDDAVPSASLGPDDKAVSPSANLGSVTPQVEPTAKPTLSDKASQCAALIAFVAAKTGFQPPTQKSVRDLIDNYPLTTITDAFEEIINHKDKSQLCATVKLFFQVGAPGIILGRQQREFMDNLNWAMAEGPYKGNPIYNAEELESVLQEAPAGIAESVIHQARKRHKEYMKSQTQAVLAPNGVNH